MADLELCGILGLFLIGVGLRGCVYAQNDNWATHSIGPAFMAASPVLGKVKPLDHGAQWRLQLLPAVKTG